MDALQDINTALLEVAEAVIAYYHDDLDINTLGSMADAAIKLAKKEGEK